MPNYPFPPQVYLDTHYIAPTGASIACPDAASFANALLSANLGDEIVLTSGVTYVGNFTMPLKSTGTGYITIRSSDPRSLPAEGKRTGPSYQPYMANIQSNNAGGAIGTADGAHHFRIMGVEISVAPLSQGLYSLIQLDSSTGAASLYPHDCIIDRCYIHGNSMGSVRRGIQMGGYNMAVVDSYIFNCKCVYGKGIEANAIACWQGPGPYKIHGNYLEASTENVIFGGSSSTSNLYVIPSDVEITGNYFSKPLSWMNAIIPAPTVATSLTAGGSLPAGTYYYQVVALGSGSNDQGVYTLNSALAEVTITCNGSNSPTLNWSPVAYSDSTDPRTTNAYLIYRTQQSSVPNTSRTMVVFAQQAGTSFVDTGNLATTPYTYTTPAGLGPTPPDHTTGDLISVKNLLEFKNMNRCVVEGNVLENCWVNGQGGTAVLFTPRSNEYNWMTPAQKLALSSPNANTSDILIQNNEIRHCAGAFAVAGVDDLCTDPNRAISRRNYINNNLAWDMTDQFSYNHHAFCFSMYTPVDFTANHNTTVCTGIFSSARGQVNAPSTNETWTNNIVTGDLNNANPQLAGPAGLFSTAVGNVNLVYQRNLIVQATPNTVNLAAWQAAVPDSYTQDGLPGVQFTDSANGNYKLLPTSPYVGKALDGTDLGVNWAQLQAKVAGVASGTANIQPTPAPAPPPPVASPPPPPAPPPPTPAPPPPVPPPAPVAPPPAPQPAPSASPAPGPTVAPGPPPTPTATAVAPVAPPPPPVRTQGPGSLAPPPTFPIVNPDGTATSYFFRYLQSLRGTMLTSQDVATIEALAIDANGQSGQPNEALRGTDFAGILDTPVRIPVDLFEPLQTPRDWERRIAELEALLAVQSQGAIQQILRPMREIPKPAVDGVTTAFTLSFAPIKGTLLDEVNGLTQNEGTDFTLAGNTITFATAPKATDTHFAQYFY